MTTIQPEGDDLRQAVKWISEMRKGGTKKSVRELIDEASIKFDLSPKDEEFLFRFITENDG